MILAFALAGCAGSSHGGYASYDNLKVARETCVAKGGELTLARNGDPAVMADYVCKRK